MHKIAGIVSRLVSRRRTAFVESFNGRLRDELLAVKGFSNGSHELLHL